MPLHDWTDFNPWAEFHSYWLGWLARDIKTKLPAGYRAHVTNLPTLTLGVTTATKPDMGVIRPPVPPPADPSPPVPWTAAVPDFEAELLVLDPPEQAVVVEYSGVLVTALEVISFRNKDRPEVRETNARKYLGHLRQMVHLTILDVLPRPHGFSFADALAAELRLPDHTPMPAPMGVSYQVDGRLRSAPVRLTGWCRRFTPGQPLPEMPLAIGEEAVIPVDLEGTYMKAAADSYLS